MAVTGLKSGVAAASFYLIRHITMREEADHALGSFFAGAGTGWWMSIGAAASKSAVARNMIACGLLGLGIWAVEKEAYVQLQKALFHDELPTSVPIQLSSPSPSSSSANAETEKEARKPLFEVPTWFPIRPAKDKSSNNS
jgi:hypothetical protein